MHDETQTWVNPTPANRELLGALLEKTAFLTESAIPRIERTDGENRFPLSPVQQGLWFLVRADESGVVYNLPLQVQVNGELNPGTLQQALEALVARHELLRVSIREADGEPGQVVTDQVDLPYEFVSLVDLSARQRAVKAQELALQTGRTVFDLSRAPLFRVMLIQLEPEDFLLLLTFHHIIFDGWSMRIFFRDLLRLYREYSQGEPPGLRPLPVQYPDFAIWLGQWLEQGGCAAQLSYWKEKLAPPLPCTEFPTKGSRPVLQTRNNGACHKWIIPAELAEQIAGVSKACETTAYIFLLATFKTVLHRYSGLEDMVVGSPVANRDRPELRDVIGCFINMLALRTTINSQGTFSELLSAVSETCLEAFACAYVPFEQVVAELPLERDPSRHPVYQIIFQFRDDSVPPRIVDGVTFCADRVDIGVSQVDLTFDIEQADGGWPCRFEYNKDLFDTATIEFLAGHFMTALEAVCSNPMRKLCEIPLLTTGERDRILLEWNATQADFPRDKCTHQLIEEQAADWPDRVAVLFEGEEITYAELNDRANRLAHLLLKRGVQADVKVGVCLARGPELVIAALAIWKAGGAYVPLDPVYPPERIAYMLEDADAALLLTEKSVMGVTYRVSHAKTETVVIDAVDISGAPAKNPQVETDPRNPAYVVYTSGSTGHPKGTQIEHHSFVNFLRSMQQAPGLTRMDTVLAITTPCLDIAGLELFLPLITGAKTAILPRETAMNGHLLAEQIEKTGTVLQATPSTWRMLLDSGWRGSRHLKMLCGGEIWPRELAAELLQGGGELWNMHGSPETTVWSGVEQVKIGDTGPILLGRPIDNTSFYIMDRNLQMLPAGMTGELCIGGEGVSRGYYKMDGLTAEQFVPDPFSSVPGARLYKTGNLARRKPDGRIEFLRRKDLQVNIRGFRIELEEVESVMMRFPGIQQAMAQACQSADGNNQLTGCYTIEAEQEVEGAKLRKWMEKNLPDEMIPQFFIQLDEIPMTAEGKVDRQMLPKPGAEALAVSAEFIEPQTAGEKALAEIWCEVLELEQVGIRDNFFELGGHSLLAIKLIDRLGEAGYNLRVEQLFLHPTIDGMARVVRQSFAVESADLGWSSLVALKRGDGNKVPLFFIHTAPGDVLIYANLIHRLKADQPCYGFQSLGLHDTGHLHGEIEAMAAHYVELLIKFYPSGPYMLVGWAYGGMVAAEMAVQLKEQGHEVALLALCDTWAHAPAKRALRVKYNRERLQKFRTLSFKAKKDFVLKRIRNRLRAGKKSEVERQLEVKVTRGILKNRAAVYRHNIEAERKFATRYYPGEVCLFRPDLLNPEFLPDLSMGWHSLVDDYEVFLIPGDHRSMIHEPNVQLLARHLQHCIDGC
ncbi:MAG: amino acid adenylation domain-containing protein [Kiritimatiellales bacterium]|nr:amino acid adenylation domain-containing protein [Kiritimatiellales bacterium]